MCRNLVDNGFSDMKVIVENEEIDTIKCLFCGNNEILSNLIKDNLFNGSLKLFDDCTKIGFYELEKYYSCGKVKINEYNFIDILKICIYYNENVLLKEVEKFINKNIFNKNIIIKLLQSNLYNFKKYKGIKHILKKYLQLNGYKLFENNIIINLPIESIEYICNNYKISGSDIDILKILLKYYQEKKVYYNIKERIYKILINIDYEKIDINELNENEKNILNEFDGILMIIENIKKRNKLIKLDIFSNNLKTILIKYNRKNSFIEIDNEDMNIIDEKEIIDIIYKINYIEDINILVIILLIINKKGLKNRISNNGCILAKLINGYNQLINNNLKENIIKCMIMFINKRGLISIGYSCGKELVIKMLKNVIDENDENGKNEIIEYLQKEELNDKDMEEIKKYINDKEILNKLMTKRITNFSYEKNVYKYKKYENINIKCNYDGDKCKFSINKSIYNIINSITRRIRI